MITKEKLFATPKIISAKISPDAHTIAYIGANEKGVPNVFIRPKEGLSFTQLSFFDTPDIIQFFWSGDSRYILIMKDDNGTGKLQLHGFNVQTKKHIDYTSEGVNAKVYRMSPHSNRAVVGLNLTNPLYHDLYVLDFDTGKLELLFQNDGYAKFLISDDLQVILKTRINADGSWTVLKADDEIIMEISPRDTFHTDFLTYLKDKNSFYFLDNRFSDTNQLKLKSLSLLEEEQILGKQKKSDIDDILFINGKPAAYASYYAQKEWHIIDDTAKEDILFLQTSLSSDFEVINQSQNEQFWIVSNSIPTKGNQFWLYQRDMKSLQLLSEPIDHTLSNMHTMVVKSRDGYNLVCYYTLPKEVDRGGYVDKPIPLVVYPHGGPFQVRDKLQFNPYHQWLASLGYAVLSVNFRLSSGFGKEFVNAGNGEWGGKAHLDVIDAARECIAKGITEKGKMAICGLSYGGYESLASLTFTPDFFTCCVAICGPSNLKTVFTHLPQYWEFTSKPASDKAWFFTRHAFIISMGGDPETSEGAQYLEKCSPLHHLANIKVPLLLVHGQNDHVVAELESRQIHEKMKAMGHEVRYILFPDEGHRIAQFNNRMFYMDEIEQFLSRHIGGTCHPTNRSILLESSAIIV